MKIKFFAYVLLLAALIMMANCDKSVDPEVGETILMGVVSRPDNQGGAAISSAFIFLGDSLKTQTDEEGKFLIEDIMPGEVTITCSALFARDSVATILVKENKTTVLTFTLPIDSTMGFVYGEFQDVELYNYELTENPDLADWTEKQEFEGVTGATLQYKWLPHPVGDCTVAFQDSIVAYSDGFGQYWFEIQCGTYPFIATSEGYDEQSRIVTVPPDDRVYINYYLNYTE